MPIDRQSAFPGRRFLGQALLLALALAIGITLFSASGSAEARSNGQVGQARSLTKKPGCARKAARRNLVARRSTGARSSARRVATCRRSTASGGPLLWGAWIGKQLTGTEAPWDMSAVTSFEQMAGKGAAVINFSSPFADCAQSPCSYYPFPEDSMERIRSHGSIPFFSWASQSTPANLNQPDFQLSDVIEGHHDAYIRKWAEAARDWGHPFFLRFNWEMNGNWFAWQEGVNGNQAGESVTAWRHVHDIFTEVGATNATWVWCPNVDPGGKMTDLRSLYPGDQYVDWTGLDGYNWGTNPARPDKWRSFDQLYRSTYDEITTSIAPSKPLMISEIGSTEYGGSKAEWISDAIESITTEYPQIGGVLWFEKHDDGMDWPIETSASSTAAFAAGIQNPDFATNTFGSLGGGPIAPLG